MRKGSGYVIKELLKVQKEVNKVLRKAEQEDDSFEGIVDKLGMVRMYDVGLPMHMVLGIVEEFVKDVEERERIKALAGFDEEHTQNLYDTVSVKWNSRNN